MLLRILQQKKEYKARFLFITMRIRKSTSVDNRLP